MSKMLGKDLLVYYLITGQRKFSRVALSKSCSIEFSTDVQEVSSPSTGAWKEYITKRSGWTVSCSGLIAEDATLLLNTYHGKRFRLRFGTDDGNVLEGYAVMTSLQISGELRGMTTYSVRFQGCGEITTIYPETVS